jgi:hypothetical protein
VSTDFTHGEAGTVQLSDRLWGLGAFLERTRDFSLLHRAQNGSEVHPESYPMGIGGSFPGVSSGAEFKNSRVMPPIHLELKH